MQSGTFFRFIPLEAGNKHKWSLQEAELAGRPAGWLENEMVFLSKVFLYFNLFLLCKLQAAQAQVMLQMLLNGYLAM